MSEQIDDAEGWHWHAIELSLAAMFGVSFIYIDHE